MIFSPDEDRHSVCTPDGCYRYQLAVSVADDGTATTASNLFTVYARQDDGAWSRESMIMVDETGHGPRTVGYPAADRVGTVEGHMRAAAGHIWAARKAGLWDGVGHDG